MGENRLKAASQFGKEETVAGLADPEYPSNHDSKKRRSPIV
jgi:hypothetical protein